MIRNSFVSTLMLACLAMVKCFVCPSVTQAVELVTLAAHNWDRYAPEGKEVDAIYGDFLVRTDQLVAVLAHPAERRNANMTVRNVGGCLIDLTQAQRVNDQLSAFYPGASDVRYTKVEYFCTVANQWSPIPERTVQPRLGIRCTAEPANGNPKAVTTYWFEDRLQAVRVVTEFQNTSDKPLTIQQRDAVRADRSFDVGSVPSRSLLWVHDEWWRQAYGIVSSGSAMHADAQSVEQRRPLIHYGEGNIELRPGQRTRFERFVFAGANLVDVKAIAHALSGSLLHTVTVVTHDRNGPIDRALLKITANGQPYATARSPVIGKLPLHLPPGKYEVTASAIGRPTVERSIDTTIQNELFVPFELPGFISGNIRDVDGKPIACKVEVTGVGETKDPDFGPDTEVWGVGNLIYTENGSFNQAVAPGEYELLISHGNEYDAELKMASVSRGVTTVVAATLRRTVDTTGWVSSDFHSHSSPSGDNTSSQLGRVLNLLAEHIEFAPCTEHNRVSSYVPHLRRLDASDRMATCSGIELTGSLLPVNHQNAFPLHHHPHTQDGGGPYIDSNPLTQIKRLAAWDESSEKLLQENHPNLIQIYGDRDTDGHPDGGFREMLGFMDVIEVHPPQEIFDRPTPGEPKTDLSNKIFHWMQLLNQGYRIPGVVNTDAHYNLHGSGWLRNYIKSSTDDPGKIDTMEMVHESEHGHIVMTNGPFLEVSMQSPNGSRAIPGDDLEASDGKAVLHVRVQCPNWHTINRVQIFINGTPVPELNYTFASHREKFKDGTVTFDESIDIAFDSDAHLIVAAIGEGLALGPVYGPDQGKAPPTAVSNPIFVDVDGDGFQANGDDLGYPLPEQPAAEDPEQPATATDAE